MPDLKRIVDAVKIAPNTRDMRFIDSCTVCGNLQPAFEATPSNPQRDINVSEHRPVLVKASTAFMANVALDTCKVLN